jgi:hypothetical protein
VENTGDACGDISLPLGTNDEIKAGLGGILLSDVAEGVGAGVGELIDEKSIAEVGA